MKEWVSEYLEIRGQDLDADTVQMVISELIAHIDNACTEIDWETLAVEVRNDRIEVKVRGERKGTGDEEEDL